MVKIKDNNSFRIKNRRSIKAGEVSLALKTLSILQGQEALKG